MCLLLNTCLFSCISYRRINIKFSAFDISQAITFTDIVYAVFFFIEIFQFISLEPNNGIFRGSIGKIEFFLGFEFLQYFQFKYDNYWRFYLIIIFYSSFCSILSLFIYINSGKFIKNIFKSEDILDICKLLIIISTNFCYLPLQGQLLSIIDCSQSIDSTLTSSYLSSDCSQFCFQGNHILYSVLGLSSLFLYSSISTYTRPLAQSLFCDFNLVTKPSYLYILSMSQVSILITKKIISIYSDIYSGFAASGILLCLAVYTLYDKPFNFEKIWIFQMFVLSSCSWALLFSSLFVLFDENFIFFVVGYFGVFAFGIIAIKVSNLYQIGFKIVKIPSVNSLMKFQFFKRVSFFEREKNVFQIEVRRAFESV